MTQLVYLHYNSANKVNHPIQVPPSDLPDAKLVELFRMLDVNDDGEVDLEEIVRFSKDGQGWKVYVST